MHRASLAAVAVYAAIAACSGSSTDITAPPEHLYVGDDALPAFLRVYALPLSASSTPFITLPMDKPFLLGVSSNTLAVTGLTGNVRLLSLPVTSSSSPFAVISSESNGTPVFSHGLLYQGGSSSINVYTPPFSNSTVPSSSVPTLGLTPSDLTVDPNGNLYLTTGDNSIGVVTGTTLTTVLMAAPAMAFRGMAATATRLFACGFNGPASDVFIYALPLTATATPAITMDLGDAGPESCVLDSSGNLYVGSTDGRIFVFAPPFSEASAPVLTLATPAIIFGMAIGAVRESQPSRAAVGLPRQRHCRIRRACLLRFRERPSSPPSILVLLLVPESVPHPWDLPCRGCARYACSALPCCPGRLQRNRPGRSTSRISVPGSSHSPTRATSGWRRAAAATLGALPRRPASKRTRTSRPTESWLAFTGEYGGNEDVYVVAVDSGTPRRLTWHPGPG